MAGGSASAVAPRSLRLKSPIRGDCTERGVSPAWRRAPRCGRPAGGSAASARRRARPPPPRRSAARRHEVRDQAELVRRARSRAPAARSPSRTSASGISRSSPVSCGTRAIRRPQYGLRGLWSQTRIRPPGRGDADHLGERPAHVARVGDVVQTSRRSARGRSASSSNGSAVPDASHRHDVGRARAEDLEHPRGRVDAGHRVAGLREPRRQHAGPAADVERPARAGSARRRSASACAGSARRRGRAATRRRRPRSSSKWELLMRLVAGRRARDGEGRRPHPPARAAAPESPGSAAIIRSPTRIATSAVAGDRRDARPAAGS